MCRLLIGVLLALPAGSIASEAEFLDLVTLVEPGLSKAIVWHWDDQESGNFCSSSNGIDEAKQATCWEWPDASGAKPAYLGTDAAGARYFVGQRVKLGSSNRWHGVWRESPAFDPDGVGGVSTDELILEIPDLVNSVTPEGDDRQDSSDLRQGWSFDEINGCIYLSLTYSIGTCCPSGSSQSESGRGVIRVCGLPTVAALMQSFETANMLSFRVPRFPNGLVGADWFDTYYGDLTNPLTLSNAQPLQCGYPANRPNAGDYVTIDSMPAPDPGEGVYVLTAARYQAERRLGRQSSGGQLTGRADGLPECIR